MSAHARYHQPPIVRDLHRRDGWHKRSDRRAARSADTVTSHHGCVDPDRGSARRLSIEGLALHIDNDLAQRSNR